MLRHSALFIFLVFVAVHERGGRCNRDGTNIREDNNETMLNVPVDR